jgi:hypothetical protein
MFVYVPKYKELEAEIPFANVRMSGEVRLKRYNCMGQLNYDSGWNPNRIMDNGLVICTASNAWANYISIGDSAAAINDSHTTIQNWLASSSISPAGSAIEVDPVGPNYEWSSQKTERFDPGVGTSSNIQEVTLGRYNDGTDIFARHVLGTPVTKASDETLDVLYRITYWPDLSDITAQVTIDSVDYNARTRRYYVGRSPGSGDGFGQFGPNSATDSSWRMYDGEQNSLTSTTPASGNVSNILFSSATWLGTGSVAAGTYYRDFEWLFDLDYYPSTKLVRTVSGRCYINTFFSTRLGTVSGDNRMPKDETQIFTPRWRFTWGRR